MPMIAKQRQSASEKPNKQKVVVIYGPTSSGKTDLAITLAKTFNGEVVSADSRQVYRGINIASGKVTKTEMRGIPHHLLDVADPKRKTITAFDFRQLADAAIEKITAAGKLPIVAGGTMFYIAALLREVPLPEVPPNQKLRQSLQSYSTEALMALLQKKDPQAAARIDHHNRPRIIRALEIAEASARRPSTPPPSPYEPLKLGIDIDKETLRERIRLRVHKRLRAGMVAEAKRLHRQGLSYKRMRELGLELRHLADYLQGYIDKETLAWRIERDNWRYSRRQMMWWKKDPNIIWLPYDQPDAFISQTKAFLAS